MIHSAQIFWEHLLYIFQTVQNMEPYFSYSSPQKCVLGPGDVLGRFGMSKKSSICLQYCKFSINSLRCSTKVFPVNLPVNMALAFFQKHFLKHRNIFERGIGKILIFLIELPIELPIVLPIVLPIALPIVLP